jgi:hypothetical protein
MLGVCIDNVTVLDRLKRPQSLAQKHLQCLNKYKQTKATSMFWFSNYRSVCRCSKRTLVFSWVRVAESLDFCVVFCGPVFVFLSFLSYMVFPSLICDFWLSLWCLQNVIPNCWAREPLVSELKVIVPGSISYKKTQNILTASSAVIAIGRQFE